jgi:hypothetical protein
LLSLVRELFEGAMGIRHLCTDVNATPNASESSRDPHAMGALRDAALQLFSSRGYDFSTLEEIEAAAGATSKTALPPSFTKETVLFEGEAVWCELLAASYCMQPKHLCEMDALCAAMVHLAPRVAERRRALRLYQRSLRASATLRGLDQERLKRQAEHLARAIARRRGSEQQTSQLVLIASIATLAYRRALDRWIEGRADVDLGEIVADEFALLAAAFDGASRTKARSEDSAL